MRRPYRGRLARSRALATLVLLVAAVGCASDRTRELLAEGSAGGGDFDVLLEIEPRSGLFVVPVRLGGREAHFLLDSGAPTAIGPALRAELALETRSRTRAVDARGTETEVDVVGLPPVSIGGVEFRDMAAVVVDVGAVAELRCIGVEGLIGANLMRQAAWRIDVERGVLRFARTLERLGVPSGAPSARFITLDSGSPLLRPLLDDDPVEEMVLDTGANVGIVAPARLLSEAERSRAVRVSGSSGAAALGYGALSSTGWFAPVLRIEIGDLTVSGGVVEFRQETSLLGTRFLRDYVVTIDWRSRRLWFEPRSVERPPSTGFGFDVIPAAGGLAVSTVIVDTPAWRAGLRPGQALLSLNGRSVESISDARYCRIREQGLAPPTADRLSVRWRTAEGVGSAELERIRVTVEG